MKTLNLVQGSAEWLAARMEYFTASEAPAMMGESKYHSRNQLLDHKKGWITEIDEFTQKLFDKGHASEDAARPIAESIIEDELYPVVGVLEGTKFLASFDGLTICNDIAYEHKLFNKVLCENVINNLLEPHYYWQLEHQLLVSGADSVIFVTSDGTEHLMQHMMYASVPERRAALIAGWAQFEKDLATHEIQAKTEKATAEQITDLPAIRYEMNGLSLTSNLDAYKDAALALVEKSNQLIETDQDFANADARQKIFTKAESDIKALADRVLGEAADIETFTKDLRFIGEQIRQARLAEGKQLKSRKEDIRKEISGKAFAVINTHGEMFSKLGVVAPAASVSITDSMKNKKTVAALQDAADTAVSQIKIELDAQYRLVDANVQFMQSFKEYKFLFNDWRDIAFKANDDFQAFVKTRIADHKVAEQKKADELRESIRIEEEARATKIASDNLEEQRQADAKKVADDKAAADAKETPKHVEAVKVDAAKPVASTCMQKPVSAPHETINKSVKQTAKHADYDRLRAEAHEDLRMASNKWHAFASILEVGQERTWAFGVYENIRLAAQAQDAA